MPLPLALPLLVKGGIVAFKFIASKHAALTATKAVVVATHTYGTAATATAVAQGLLVIGGVTWTIERVGMGKKALECFDSGDWLGAANELTKIGRSVFQVEGSAFVDELNVWVSNGASIHAPEFRQIVSDLRQIVDEANITNQQLRGA